MTWILTTILIVVALLAAMKVLVPVARPQVAGSPHDRMVRFTTLIIALVVVGIPAISAAFYFGCQSAESFR